MRHMSRILYYSNHCPNCQQLLATVAKHPAKDDIHFISVDDRVTKDNGATYVRLSNQQELLLPPTITRVPALLLLNKGHHVLFGEEIERHLKPSSVQATTTGAQQGPGEPQAFSFGGAGGFGVASDTFSFLDQSAEQLSAKGEGGMRQTHHYARPGAGNEIETPPDTYEPDKVGAKSAESLAAAREAAVPQQARPSQHASP